MKSRAESTSQLAIICLVCCLGLKGLQAEPIECYSCTDRGDGGCLPDKAVNVSCPEDYSMCVETITAIKTSHDNHVVLKKGCGFGDSAVLDKSITSYGISLYMQLVQCNTSLCNNNMDLKHYQLAPDDNTTREPNDDQCYSCVGSPKAECSPSNAPVMQCYNMYSHCLDGNVTVSIDNDTTVIPLKSCSTRYRCGRQSITYGSVTIEMKGVCCSDGVCNQDLSNETHQVELPYLVLLNDQNEELTNTAAPPQWVSATETAPTNGSMAREGDSQLLPQDHQSNSAGGLSFPLSLFLMLFALS